MLSSKKCLLLFIIKFFVRFEVVLATLMNITFSLLGHAVFISI